VAGIGRGFAPGHITGFFEIFDDVKEPQKKGSRGAGFCTDLGVTTVVELDEGEKKIDIFLNGEPNEAVVTRRAIEQLLPTGDFTIKVSSEFELPVSQGFGISGAGALSAGLALMQALREYKSHSINFNNVVEAAHVADVNNKTGLGDVVAQVTGGFTIRKAPGLPPEKNVLHMHTLHGLNNPTIVLLCVVGDECYSPDILTDPKKRESINKIGGKYVDEIVSTPSLELLMMNSYRFVHETGLISPEVDKAVEAISEICPASMSCLGQSVFCLTTEERIADEVAGVLSEFGKLYLCSVDPQGARVLPQERKKTPIPELSILD
jgi:pantoate kinase